MSVIAMHPARYAVLSVELSGRKPVNAGVLLEDPLTDRLWVRVRRDWGLIDPEQSDVLDELESDLAAKSSEWGAAKLMAHLEDVLSNAIRITDRRDVTVEDFPRALGRIYREHVSPEVQPFVTHLPRFSLAIAAGSFLENQEVRSEGWEEAPPDLRLAPGMFVARVVGRSMEPVIPDGSLCVFRSLGAGSRQGRLVLVEDTAGANDRHTVKRYRSAKHQNPEGTWSHEQIRLEPLNPEFEAWDLNPEEDRFRVLAEFVRVLD